jgi:hypothetical protein
MTVDRRPVGAFRAGVVHRPDPGDRRRRPLATVG